MKRRRLPEIPHPDLRSSTVRVKLPAAGEANGARDDDSRASRSTPSRRDGCDVERRRARRRSATRGDDLEMYARVGVQALRRVLDSASTSGV